MKKKECITTLNVKELWAAATMIYIVAEFY